MSTSLSAFQNVSHKSLIISSPNRLDAWCKQRSLPPTAINFLSKLFTYDPDKRMNARDALSHSWFQEDPHPTYKSVWFILPILYEVNSIPLAYFNSSSTLHHNFLRSVGSHLMRHRR